MIALTGLCTSISRYLNPLCLPGQHRHIATFEASHSSMYRFLRKAAPRLRRQKDKTLNSLAFLDCKTSEGNEEKERKEKSIRLT